MKTLRKIFLGILCLPLLLSAQDDKSYGMVELSYMKVKVGMEAKFEAAIKAHNDKYHKEGKYQASLYNISTGKMAGWYVWTMGPCTFTDLDGRPGEGEHEKEWEKNVTPLIESYGRVEYWRYNKEFSNSKESAPKMLTIWWVDVSRGQYYRYKAFMTKVAEIYREKGDELNVYDNTFGQNDGRDVAFVWPLENWAAMDKDDWNMKEEYEKKNGEGSWTDAMKDWEEMVEGVVEEVWREVK